MSPTFPLADQLFRQLLLNWYQAHGRVLPWRKTKDPYKIWLSEVILQQTRVAQGMAYYTHFIEQYPSVHHLAATSEQAVLRSWQGLGYYSRARNLHHCAQTLVQEHNGTFPTHYRELLRLKGIGPYTAAAIAAICFKRQVAAVDGNVYRFLARLFGLHSNISTTKGQKIIHTLANKLVDPDQPDVYSQAIIDFGALQCTPKSPLCMSCVFQPFCQAFAQHQTHLLPIKIKKKVQKKRYFDYFVLNYQGDIYMKKRTQKDIWKGMYDFYLLEHSEPLSLSQMQDPLLDLLFDYQLPIVSHQQEVIHLLTHQKLWIKFHQVRLSNHFMHQTEKALQAYALSSFGLSQLRSLPKPRPIDDFMAHYL